MDFQPGESNSSFGFDDCFNDSDGEGRRLTRRTLSGKKDWTEPSISKSAHKAYGSIFRVHEEVIPEQEMMLIDVDVSGFIEEEEEEI